MNDVYVPYGDAAVLLGMTRGNFLRAVLDEPLLRPRGYKAGHLAFTNLQLSLYDKPLTWCVVHP